MNYYVYIPNGNGLPRRLTTPRNDSSNDTRQANGVTITAGGGNALTPAARRLAMTGSAKRSPIDR